MPNLQRISQNAFRTSFASGGNLRVGCLSYIVLASFRTHALSITRPSIALEIFDSGAGVEDHDAFAGSDFSATAKQFQSCETSCAFGTDEETFVCSHLVSDPKHFFVFHSNGAAVGLTKNVQHHEVANRFWNAQARCDRMRVGEFGGGLFSGFESADDGRTTGGLHREHARTFLPDPAERFQFIECFPHSNESGAAAGWIKNYVRQDTVQL